MFVEGTEKSNLANDGTFFGKSGAVAEDEATGQGYAGKGGPELQGAEDARFVDTLPSEYTRRKDPIVEYRC